MNISHYNVWIFVSLIFLPLWVFLLCGCEDDGDAPGINALYQQSFDTAPDGLYTSAQVDAEWNNPSWSRGPSEGRVAIVSSDDSLDGKSMQVAFPQGAVGLRAGGAAWFLGLGRSYNRLLCSYRFRFAPGFDFVRGGKLPGLAGGAANTGGKKPNGTDGWSARLMWHSGGRLSAYVYHPDQPRNYGEDFFFSSSASAGVWHEVTMRVTMNTPGIRDGSIECWLNGDNVLNERNIRFRDVPSLGADQFYFCTFFGGNTSSWAPTRNETITFDDFTVGN